MSFFPFLAELAILWAPSTFYMRRHAWGSVTRYQKLDFPAPNILLKPEQLLALSVFVCSPQLPTVQLTEAGQCQNT